MVRSFAAVSMISLFFGVALADPATAPQPGYPDEPPEEIPEEVHSPATGAEVFVYASNGQTDQQLDRDRYECHKWAVTQTGFNPSDRHPAPHQQVQVVDGPPKGYETAASAISGAFTGALIGSPYDTGEGALIGAIAGGILGAISETGRRKAIQQVNAHGNSQAQDERARLEALASNYRRAIGACLEGRGYTVK